MILGFGFGVHPEYQSCAAVVTRVETGSQHCTHCTVAVLDPSRSFRVGECQVALDDVKPVHKEWRAGARLVIGGLQSSKMRHLNGHVVHVCEHRRHGHPCFVQPTSGRKDKLTLCVRLEDPIPDHATALLLEPRFLSPYIQKPLAPSQPALAPKLKLPDHEMVTLLSGHRRKQPGLSTADSKPVDLRSFPAKPSSSPPQSCSSGFLGFISWLVEAPSKAEEEHPMVCKSTSIISVDDDSPRANSASATNANSGLAGLQMLHPIPELSPGGDSGHIYSSQIPEQGDLVVLGRNVTPRFQLCAAVVKEVHSDFCNVAVLDDSRSFVVGECSVDFREIIPVHQDWRVGSRLVVGGLQSSHMRHLNGLFATVCPHKRFGHPCLIQKPSAPNQALWLTLCLRFEDTAKSQIHGALLEPRFLTPSSGKWLERFPRAPSDVASESTMSTSSYQKSLSMPSTPASSHSSSRSGKSGKSEDDGKRSSLGMRGTLDVSFHKPHLPQAASQASEEEQNVYQTHTSLTSTSSGGSYQKTSSLPSTASGRSGGIPLARMEQEVKELRSMLKVLAAKNPSGESAPNSSRGESRS